MNGIELLRAQAEKGCKLTAKNKALLTGYMDEGSVQEVIELGAAFFQKPVPFDQLSRWVRECEERMDLSLPLGLPRKEARMNDSREISYTVSVSGDTPCKGATVNLSHSGLCVRVNSPLARQTKITIQTPLPILSPITLVRWLTDAGDGAYIAGLQCVPQS